MVASLNISGVTIQQGATTMLSTLNVSGESSLLGNVTLLSSLNISGVTTHQGSTTLLSSLNVSGQSSLLGNTTLMSRLNVSGMATIQGNTTILSSLNVSGQTSLLGNVTLISQLNVSGMTHLQSNTTLNSTLNVSGNSTLQGATTVLSILSVSGVTIIGNNIPVDPATALTVNNMIKLMEYSSNTISSSFQQISTQGTYNIYDNLNSKSRMYINQSGNFGINNNNPEYTLDVGSYTDTVFNIAKLNATDRSYMSYSVSPGDINSQVSYARTFGGVNTASQNGYFAIDLLNGGTFASSLDITTSQMYMTTSQTWFKTKVGAGNMTSSGSNKVLVSDSSGYMAPSGITTTTLNYLDATSSVQTQFNTLANTLTNLSSFKNPTTALSSFNVSGNTTLQGPITGVSSLNISGNTTIQGTAYIGGTLSTRTSIYSYSNAGIGNLKLTSYGNSADDKWWIGFGHGGDAADSNDRVRIGVDIKSGGAGRLFFSTGISPSTEKMRLDENGYLGIGTSNPQTFLDINNSNPKIYLTNSVSRAFLSGISGSLDFGNDAGTNSVIRFMPNGSESIRIANNGSMGIGTTNPISLLDVRGTINAAALNIVNSGAIANGGYTVILPTNDSTHTGFIEFKLSNTNRQGYIGYATTTQFDLYAENGSALAFGVNGGYRMYINTNGNVGIGTTNPITTRKVSILGTGGTTNMVAHYNSGNPVPYVAAGYDETNDGYAVMTNQGSTDVNTTPLFIKRTTNYIGMGTTSPSCPLDIMNSAGILARFKNTGSDYARIVLDGSSGTGGDIIYKSNGVSQYGIAVIGGNMQFLLNDLTTTVPMTLTSGGLVGIGTTTPDAMLHVSGTTILGGSVSTNSTLNVSGTTVLANATTILSTLYVSGTSYLNNNITINQQSSSSITPALLFAKTSDDSNGGGLGFYYNTNGIGNRQLCFIDTSFATKNTTNNMIRFSNFTGISGMYIDSISTDGSTLRPFNIGGNSLILNHPSIHPNQYVGISTATPSATLHVSGNTKLEGATTIGSTLNVIGATTLVSTLNISGSTTIQSTLNVSGTSIIMGNVGIGTSVPLTSYSSTIPNARLSILSGASGSDGGASRISIGGNNNHYAAIEGMHVAGGSTTLALMTATNAGTNSSNPSTRLFIDSAGKVGINTTSMSALLHVNGTSIIGGASTIGSTLNIVGSVSTGSTLNVSGTTSIMANVGIGTTAPTHSLHIAKGNDSIRIGAVGFEGTAVDTTTYGLERSRNQIIFSTYRDVVLDKIGAKIIGINKQTYLDNPSYYSAIQSTDIAFFTVPPNSANYDDTIERFRITDTGNVGVGISGPSALLDVNGTMVIRGVVSANSTFNIGGATTMLSKLNVSGATSIMGTLAVGISAPTSIMQIHSALVSGTTGLWEAPDLRFTYNAGSGNMWDLGRIAGYVAAGANNDTANWPGGLLFQTKTPGSIGSLATTKMVIDSNGMIGVGTTAPMALHHVSGTSLIIGAMTANSTLVVSGSMTCNSSLNVSGLTTFVGSTTIKGYGVSSFPGLTISSDQTSRSTSLFNVTAANSGVSGSSVGDTILCTGDTASPNGNVYIQRTTGYNPVLTATVGGSVGINNVTPSSNFHVIGSTILQGATTVSSTLNVSGTSYLNGNVTVNSTFSVVSVESTTTTILNFKNNSGYGIYADSRSITSRGNTLDFKTTDYNSTNVTTRTLLTMRPEGTIGIGTLTPMQMLHVDGGNIGINSKNEINGQASLFFYNNPYMTSGNTAAKVGIISEAINNNTRAKLHLCTSAIQDASTSTSVSDARLTIGADGYVGINNTNPTSYLTVVGGNPSTDAATAPFTAEFKGNGGFDGSTVVRINNNASSFGRTQLQLLGRFEGNNDGWSLSTGRNNILFQSQTSVNSNISTNFALQNYGISRFGILSSYNASTPALTITNNNNNIGIGTDTPSALLHVSGTSILSGASTHGSTLNVMGTTILMNNLNVGTSSSKGIIQSYNQTTSQQYHLTLTGAEYYMPGSYTSTDGLAISAGVNRPNNRQLWIADTALANNTTNTQLRLTPGIGYIDAVSTDGTTGKVLTLGNSTGIISTGPITANSSINVIGTLNISSNINMTGIANTTSNNNYVLTYNNSTGAIGYNGFYVTQIFNSQSSSWSSGITSGNITVGSNSKMIQGTLTYYATAVILAQFSLIFTPVGGGTSYTFNFNKFFNNTYTHMEHGFTLALTNTQLPANTYTCQVIKSGANSGNMGTDANDQIMIAITNYPN